MVEVREIAPYSEHTAASPLTLLLIIDSCTFSLPNFSTSTPPLYLLSTFSTTTPPLHLL
jgi:hypothetical protein